MARPSKIESLIDKESYTVLIKTATAKLDTNDLDMEPADPSIRLKIREIQYEAEKNSNDATNMAESIMKL